MDGTTPFHVFYSPTHIRHTPVYHIIGDHERSQHVEQPRRLECILGSVKTIPGTVIHTCDREATDEELHAVHDPKLTNFVSNSYASLEVFTGQLARGETETKVAAPREVLPEVISSTARFVMHLPKQLHVQAGHYCFDLATPIGKYTGIEARRSAALAIDAAEQLTKKEGQPIIFALCRPPGHHAMIHKYGGYCYYNNAALAATKLKSEGFVTVLDIDYHHGNGTQDVFYERDDVGFISIHADPAFEYPFHSGGADETGHGKGVGYNLNLPLPLGTDYSGYKPALDTALKQVVDWGTKNLIISFGVDPAEGDPICTFGITVEDFRNIGIHIAKIGIPTLVVQEGGYSDDKILSTSAAALIEGLLAGVPK